MKENNNNEILSQENNNKKMKKKWWFIIGIPLLILIGTYGYMIATTMQDNAKDFSEIMDQIEETNSGRVIDYLDIEEIYNSSTQEVHDGLIETELNRDPYNESTIEGMYINWFSTGAPEVDTLSYLYNGTNLWAFAAGWSLRHPDDERIESEQDYYFNVYVNASTALDNYGKDIILSDEELASYASKAVAIAKEDSSPVQYYIEDLILNLAGTEPTLSSVFYLMEANLISANRIADYLGINYGSTDYTVNFDTSYTIEEEKDVIYSVTDAFELVNETTGVLHYQWSGAITFYAMLDGMNYDATIYTGNNTPDSGQDELYLIYHYKDISNHFLAEYGIMAGNLDLDIPMTYSHAKPAFTWCISPQIEEIATAYYDIVEPSVYLGTFTSRADAYEETVEALDGTYTLEEVVSAIQTYEYWALIE